ncbi:hypothetical protein ACFVZJ_14995, partial [Streptomyces sp. NPDC058322]|uniref:hypothetical protein n=1 Tax=Streptomyces sp. NPDC058322 TaxID=3346446 RepID=UPI0036ECAEDF
MTARSGACRSRPRSGYAPANAARTHSDGRSRSRRSRRPTVAKTYGPEAPMAPKADGPETKGSRVTSTETTTESADSEPGGYAAARLRLLQE